MAWIPLIRHIGLSPLRWPTEAIVVSWLAPRWLTSRFALITSTAPVVDGWRSMRPIVHDQLLSLVIVASNPGKRCSRSARRSRT